MRNNLELRRKLFHIFSLLLWIPPVLYLSKPLVVLVFFVVISLNLAVVLKIEPISGAFKVFIDLFERERNLSKPGIQALFANVGIFLSFILFGKEATVVGVLVLAVGDGFSGLVGYHLGRRRLFYNPSKSVEGSFAFLIGSLLTLYPLTDFQTALKVSVLGTIVESLPVKVDDNLIIPLVSAGVFYFV